MHFSTRARLASRPLAAALLLIIPFSAVQVALADSRSDTINNVMINYRLECDAPLQQLNLGNLTVDINNSSGSGMYAHFDVSNANNVTNNPHLWGCMDLHWVQFITADDAPAKVNGVPAGDPSFPFPVVDTPAHGWDYIYKDTNGTPGIQADERVPGNVDDPNDVDDANDTLPWYQTPAEEAHQAGSGNVAPNYGLGHFVPGSLYEIKDVPGLPANGGVTDFSTFLVAVPRYTCDEGEASDCLSPNEILVLAGFDWVWSSDNERFSLTAPSTVGAAQMNLALAHGGITGWTAYDSGSICCPEPSSWIMGAMAAIGLVATYRRRKATA